MRSIVVVGCGRVAQEAWAPALERLRDVVEVQALVDEVPGSLEKLREALPSHLPYLLGVRDWRRVTGRDCIVLILTPPRTAVSILLQAQQAGVRQFIVEKPFATTREDRHNLRYGLRPATSVLVNQNYLYRPDIMCAIQQVRDGAVGRVLWGRLHTLSDEHWRGASGTKDPDWRRSAITNPGGVIADKGYHLVYLAEALGDAHLTTLRAVAGGSPGCPSRWCAVAATGDGAIWSLAATWEKGINQVDTLEIVGSVGSISISHQVGAPLIVTTAGQCIEHEVSGDWWGIEECVRAALRGESNLAEHDRQMDMLISGSDFDMNGH